MRRFPLVLLGAAAGFGPPTGPVYAQQSDTRCEFLPGTRSLVQSTFGNDQVFYVGGPRIRCDDGVRILADSAVAYTAQNLTYLYGNVRYTDPTREMRSDEARYFSRQARLQAEGHVFMRDTEQGSIIRDGSLVYLPRTDFRDTEQMTVETGPDGVRPHATLNIRPEPSAPPADSAGAAADTLPAGAPPDAEVADTAAVPYDVVANRLLLIGDGYFRATGAVEIERDSLRAYADTAEYDRVSERMVLEGRARLESTQFDLAGRSIRIGIPGGQVRTVRATRDAILTGDDLQLTSPLVHLELVEGALERLVAVPLRAEELPEGVEPGDSTWRARPVAVAERFRITADSLDVRAPGQILERIDAVGRARGESTARDSLNVEILPDVARRDWLEGDTVIATFVRAEPDPDTPPDTAAAGYLLDRLVAAGSARSVYRMAPRDSTSRAGVDAPALHYVTGDRIVIGLVGGEVDVLDVEGDAHGWHLEPLAGPRAAPDTTARPDTAAAGAGPAGAAPPVRLAPSASLPAPGARRPAPVRRSAPRGEVAARPAGPRAFLRRRRRVA